MYIQSAKNQEKNESLSKNKCLKIFEHFVENRNKSYKLFVVSKRLIAISINIKREGEELDNRNIKF